MVGILGGGQLGRMLALAGTPLGLRFRFLDPSPDPPVQGLGQVVRAQYDDAAALEAFRDGLDLVTYEFENVPAAAVEMLAPTVSVLPPAAALHVAQDRLTEKETFRRLGVKTAPFHPVDTRAELDRGIEALGLPCVLKTRRLGYDGKGQRVLREAAEVDSSWEELGGVPLLLEGFVPFTRELSVIGVRGRDGNTAFYPLTENKHQDGILRTSRAPIPGFDPARQQEGQEIAGRILDTLDYVGVLAVELFDTPEGLLANEIAPRVHNSGHWTQDGAVTSQFENHLRAVLGLPLGSPEARGWSAMINLIGTLPPRRPILELPGTHLHLYDKEPRPGRKLGHVNVVAESPEALAQRLEMLEGVLG